MNIKIAATTALALGVTGVFAVAGTAHAQDESGYACATAIYLDTGAVGVGCAALLGAPAAGIISSSFSILSADNGVLYGCSPAVSAGRALAISGLAITPAAVVGLLCLPPLPN
jgi:hypothetical protein